MEKMLVVVFDNEKKAREGYRALNELDFEGDITIYAESIIVKNADGTCTVRETESIPLRVAGGTAIGGLIGLLGGPLGVAVGGTAGAMAGMVTDIEIAGVDEDFLMDVSAVLLPGKYAVVADLSEEWVTPVDMRMEDLGGIVFRISKRNYEADKRTIAIAALKMEIADLKAEKAEARADRKTKLQAKSDVLEAKLKIKQAEAEQRLDQTMSEADAKIKALEEKEAKARGDAKAKLKARKAEIREDYQVAKRNSKELKAMDLERIAKKLENKAAKLKKE